MNILLTGCCGFIGTNLSLKLLKLGFTVYGVDNMNDYYNIKIKNKNLSDLQIYPNFIFHMESFEKILDKIYLEHKIDLVIHLAASGGVRYSMMNPIKYFDNNLLKSITFLEKIKFYKIKHIIFASSSSVYGNINSKMFSEEIKLSHKNIVSYYALSKKHLEEVMELFSRINKVNIIGFRFFTVYGPRCRPDMAVCKFLSKIHHDKEIQVFGDGTTIRDYTYIDDIVNGIILGIEKIKNIKFDIFNLGNGKKIMLNQMVKTCESVVGKKANIKYTNIPIGDVKFTLASNEKAKEILNYHPSTVFSDGIDKTFNYIVSNLDLYI